MAELQSDPIARHKHVCSLARVLRIQESLMVQMVEKVGQHRGLYSGAGSLYEAS